jgi:two-component system sensor histidine kinase MprB
VTDRPPSHRRPRWWRWRPTSLRARLILSAAAAVAVAVAGVASFAYSQTRHELHGQVDSALRDRAASLTRFRDEHAPGGQRPGGGPGPDIRDLPPPDLGGGGVVTRYVESDGTVTAAADTPDLPVTADARAVATGTKRESLTNIDVGGEEVRVLTVAWTPGRALQVARPLNEVNDAVGHIGVVLLIVSFSGVVVAAGLGFLVARAALRPVHVLDAAVRDVSQTRDLTRRIDVPGTDEVGRLAGSFNAMLGALDEAQRAQRRLAADASHELRTPLTSLRTNVEVLLRDGLDLPDRERLARDVDAQIVELSNLVGSMMEMARGDEPAQAVGEVDLEELVANAVEQAAFHWPLVQFTTDLAPSIVVGVGDRIETAIANLLDNAGKWSTAGGTVEVVLGEGEVSVRDHGPGIDADDAGRVFERFWRAPAARGMPGSGLGLAIVRQVAEQHGGEAWVDAPLGGGARFHLRLQ